MRFGKSVVVALVLTLALVGTALAAHPKAGKSYAGFTSSKYKNWRAPVKFKVTTNDKSLTGFTWSTLGCSGFGGPITSDPYTKPYALQHLGTIVVKANGHFSVKHVETKWVVPGNSTTETFSSVSGKFTNAKTATGTITYTQTVLFPHGVSGSSCGPAHVTFSAKMK